MPQYPPGDLGRLRGCEPYLIILHEFSLMKKFMRLLFAVKKSLS